MNEHNFITRLQQEWDNKSVKMDWLKYETFMVDLYSSTLTTEFKVRAGAEALNAWTKRGHGFSCVNWPKIVSE